MLINGVPFPGAWALSPGLWDFRRDHQCGFLCRPLGCQGQKTLVQADPVHQSQGTRDGLLAHICHPGPQLEAVMSSPALSHHRSPVQCFSSDPVLLLTSFLTRSPVIASLVLSWFPAYPVPVTFAPCSSRNLWVATSFSDLETGSPFPPHTRESLIYFFPGGPSWGGRRKVTSPWSAG